MKTADEVLSRARTVIQDETSRRWPLTELCQWLNDGQLVIATQKPSATARTVDLPLAVGTRQTLPAGYQSVLRVIRNVRGPSSTREPRRSISVVQDTLLDSYDPTWHDPDYTHYEQQVKHVAFDEANPKTFYVYPGNNGSGRIEVVLSAIPSKIVPMGNPDNLASYRVNLGLDESYGAALLWYVLYMAYAKDAQFVGNAGRAVAAFQTFANLIGVKLAAEASLSLNAEPGIGQAAPGVA